MKMSQTRSHPLPSNEELLSQIRLLLDSPEDDLQAAIMKELLAGTLRLHDSHLDILDLKFVNRAVKELRHAFRVFHNYRDRRKISIFGSARTASDDPNYELAFQFSRRIVEEGFMVITGGGRRDHARLPGGRRAREQLRGQYYAPLRTRPECHDRR